MLLHPVDGKVSDLIGAVALVAFTASIHLDEVRVVVAALTWKDFPIIKSGWVGAQMPFANHGRVVSSVTKDFGEGGLLSVKPIAIAQESIEVTMLACQDAGSGGAAN